MPFKSEPGTIRKVERGLRPLYQVELRSGGTVYVSNDQITPPRITLLPVGEQLLVTFNEHGKVTTAIWKNSLNGRVIKVEGYGPSLVYRVELDNGKILPVSREVIEFHPDHTLSINAEMDITLTEGLVKKARLLREWREVKVHTLNLERGVIVVKGQQGEPYTIRMSNMDLRQAVMGERLVMEIQYTEKGDRKIVLERPKQKSPGPEPKNISQINTVTEKEQSASNSPGHISFEATLSGIDQAYLSERLKEKHRPEIMSFLEEHSRDGLLEWYHMRDAVAPRFNQPERPLSSLIKDVLRQAEPDFKDFYLHQAIALDAIRNGKHIVIVTQTASGKTLCYNPAIFERICDEPGAHALYLFPLNALMTDQKEKIDTFCHFLAQQGVHVSAERLQGGLSKEQRQQMAQRSPNLLATNPEMLSVVLNEVDRWASFFRTLRYIVIDEVHTYRGIFGVHMSGLLRRLLIAAKRFGSEPQMILCSATVSNPLDLATRLTALPAESFCLISEKEDGSHQDFKHWAVLNPDWGSSGTGYDHYLDVAASVFVELISGRRSRTRSTQPKIGPLNTILFARSIREVNR